MDYRDIAVYKEREFRNKCENLTMMLYNAIICLEEAQVFDTHDKLLDNLNMAEKEYKKIMEG